MVQGENKQGFEKDRNGEREQTLAVTSGTEIQILPDQDKDTHNRSVIQRPSLILLLCSNVWALKKCKPPGMIFNVRKRRERKIQTTRMIGNVAKEEKIAKNLRAMSRDFS